MVKLDEWIIGEGLESSGNMSMARWYVIHTAEPRFMVEICDEDEAPVEGITWSLPCGQIACNAEFYDEPPVGEKLNDLIFSISEILDDYDERVDRRNERGMREEDF